MKQISVRVYQGYLQSLIMEHNPYERYNFLGVWLWTKFQELKYKWQLWKEGTKIMDEFTYEEVKAGLQSSKATVVFQKTDGTFREMNCTLKEEFLPPFDKNAVGKATNEEVLAVWDLDKNAWRSFRLDSVVSIDYK